MIIKLNLIVMWLQIKLQRSSLLLYIFLERNVIIGIISNDIVVEIVVE